MPRSGLHGQWWNLPDSYRGVQNIDTDILSATSLRFQHWYQQSLVIFNQAIQTFMSLMSDLCWDSKVGEMKFLSKFWYSSATVKQRWKTLDTSISYSLRNHYNWDHLCGVADHFVALESLTRTQAKPVTLNNIMVSVEYGVFLQRGTPRSQLA